ncbi:MAG TPA: hypothetical protein VLX91_08270 [Candidatus Acidoferrales bacterium]|nr:hypothetical protein [Candidatus Acidoferrales bacterium]
MSLEERSYNVHYHPAKILITSSFMMMMTIYLVIGSLWVAFGLAFELTLVEEHQSFEIVMTSVSILWSAVSLIISLYFINQVRRIMKRVRHEGKT